MSSLSVQHLPDTPQPIDRPSSAVLPNLLSGSFTAILFGCLFLETQLVLQLPLVAPPLITLTCIIFAFSFLVQKRLVNFLKEPGNFQKENIYWCDRSNVDASLFLCHDRHEKNRGGEFIACHLQMLSSSTGN